MAVGQERTVAFTDRHMLLCKPKFKTHREFVEWLFKKQHKCTIEIHEQLKYYYYPWKGQYITEVRGTIGRALKLW